VSAALYMSEEGASMFYSLVTTLSAVMLGVLLVLGIRFLLRRQTLSMGLLAGLGLALFLGSAAPAKAIERRGGTVITVPAGQTIDDSLVAAGQFINIDGTVNGNVYLSSQHTIIRGDIKGDVFSFSQSLDINGTVEGNVYAYSDAITVRGHITRGLHVFGGTLDLQKGGQVSDDAMGFCGTFRLDGTVGRDVNAMVGTAELTGEVGRNVNLRTDNLAVLAPAHINGDLKAGLKDISHARVEPGAIITGKTDVYLRKQGPTRYAQPRFYFWQAVRLGGALLTGFVLFLLFPVLFGGRLETARATLVALGVGFLVFVATPIAAVIAGITLVGLPLGILGLLTWIASLYLAKVFVGAALGQMLLGPGDGGKASFAAALLLGLFILYVAMNLPYVGGVLTFLVLLLGPGLVARQLLGRQQRAEALSH
jgi:cytoskeletal protein CcmA (bactofilin family)